MFILGDDGLSIYEFNKKTEKLDLYGEMLTQRKYFGVCSIGEYLYIIGKFK